MKVIDIRDAVNVLALLKHRGNTEGAKVGILVKDSPTEVGEIKQGTVVLFRLGHLENECTIERPMNRDELAVQYRKNSLLVTTHTTVGIPEEYLVEIVY